MSVEDERKLFVAGLDESATEQELRQLFESTGGNVEEVVVPRDRATGKIRGFAFLTMATSGDARIAREQLDGSIQAGRSISVREFRGDRTGGPAQRPSHPPPQEDATLYVGNLPFDATVPEIEGLFRTAGFDDVRRVHLPVDAEGRARGFGFVTLGSAASAKRAADLDREFALRSRSLSVSVARARGTAPPPGGAPRPSRPPPRAPSARPPARGPGPDFAEPSFAPSAPPATGGDADARRSAGRWEKKDKKRKGRLGAAGEKDPERRRGGGARSSRGDDYREDWEDD